MTARNLVFFHDSSGKVDAVGPLAGRLPEDVRVLGLERRSDTAKLRTVSDLAAEHLRRLRLLQPRGPWYLAGWSFGGNLAFEAARLLQAQGEEVRRLVIIDSPPPGLMDWEALYRESLQALGLPPHEEADLAQLIKAAGGMSASGEPLADRLPASIRDAVPPADRADSARFSRALGTVLDHVRLLAGHRHAGAVSPGGAVCLGASQSGPAITDGWRAWLNGPATYQEVAGDHRSILRAPAVEQAARAVNFAMSGLN